MEFPNLSNGTVDKILTLLSLKTHIHRGDRKGEKVHMIIKSKAYMEEKRKQREFTSGGLILFSEQEVRMMDKVWLSGLERGNSLEQPLGDGDRKLTANN